MSSEAPTVQWDSDEPYLQVTSNTRITPHRPTDTDDWVELNNAPEIAEDNFMFPKPFSRDLAEKQINGALEKSTHLIEKLRKGEAVPGCPFNVLRHDSGKVIGTLSLWGPADDPMVTYSSPPSPYPWSHEEWGVGYNVHPEYTGQGLGGKMIDVLVRWACADQGMGVWSIASSTLATNNRSHHILQKTGFKEARRRTFTYKKGDIEKIIDDVSFVRRVRE